MKIRAVCVSTFYRPKVCHLTIEVAASRKSEVVVKTLCGASGEWFNYGFRLPRKLGVCSKCSDVAGRDGIMVPERI